MDPIQNQLSTRMVMVINLKRKAFKNSSVDPVLADHISLILHLDLAFFKSRINDKSIYKLSGEYAENSLQKLHHWISKEDLSFLTLIYAKLGFKVFLNTLITSLEQCIPLELQLLDFLNTLITCLEQSIPLELKRITNKPTNK